MSSISSRNILTTISPAQSQTYLLHIMVALSTIAGVTTFVLTIIIAVMLWRKKNKRFALTV